MATTANGYIDPRIRMQREGLYDPFFEHSSCGVGFVVNVDGRRTHQIVLNGITILKNLVHRGAVGGDSRTGDGAGMLTQVPYRGVQGHVRRAPVRALLP